MPTIKMIIPYIDVSLLPKRSNPTMQEAIIPNTHKIFAQTIIDCPDVFSIVKPLFNFMFYFTFYNIIFNTYYIILF